MHKLLSEGCAEDASANLQEPAVTAEDLEAIVLGHFQEAIGGKHDGVVRQVGVADAEILLDALHCRRQIQRHPEATMSSVRTYYDPCCEVVMIALHFTYHQQQTIYCSRTLCKSQ